MHTFDLDRKLSLGAILGGLQSDGAAGPTAWRMWEEFGLTHGALHAAGHLDNWQEDIRLVRQMGLPVCRFCLEWPRIEPREGQFDEEAISRIAQELYLLRSKGVRLSLTLHRFSDPIWFLEKGGWENPDNILCFLRYTEKILRTLGHLASEYIVLDEANLYAMNGYCFGIWPPGKKSLSTAMQVMSVLAAAHIRSYKLIHAVRREIGFDETRVGCSIHMRAIEPKNAGNPLHRTAAAQYARILQLDPARAMLTGCFRKPLKNYALAREGIYADFIGLAYYTRSVVGTKGTETLSGVFQSDPGWEIWPEGLTDCARQLYSICRLPLQVTANGVCDSSDSYRCRFLYDHLMAISRSGLPFERYYYRSLLDGFEWELGESACFGLIDVDPETGLRSFKRSGAFFSQIIRDHGVTDQSYKEFVEQERYHLK